MKLAVVASDMLGVSGRAMLEALLQGTTDPELARRALSREDAQKIPELRRALQGRFGAHQRFLVGRILAHLDYLDEAIEECGHQIKGLLHPSRRSSSA